MGCNLQFFKPNEYYLEFKKPKRIGSTAILYRHKQFFAFLPTFPKQNNQFLHAFVLIYYHALILAKFFLQQMKTHLLCGINPFLQIALVFNKFGEWLVFHRWNGTRDIGRLGCNHRFFFGSRGFQWDNGNEGCVSSKNKPSDCFQGVTKGARGCRRLVEYSKKSSFDKRKWTNVEDYKKNARHEYHKSNRPTPRAWLIPLLVQMQSARTDVRVNVQYGLVSSSLPISPW
jgi:hypothetical protein